MNIEHYREPMNIIHGSVPKPLMALLPNLKFLNRSRVPKSMFFEYEWHNIFFTKGPPCRSIATSA